MRIQIYDEEISGEVMRVTKTASDTGKTFTGLRIFLVSPDVLHHEPGDDDRSAITFWYEEGNLSEETLVRSTLRTASEVRH